MVEREIKIQTKASDLLLDQIEQPSMVEQPIERASDASQTISHLSTFHHNIHISPQTSKPHISPSYNKLGLLSHQT